MIIKGVELFYCKFCTFKKCLLLWNVLLTLFVYPSTVAFRGILYILPSFLLLIALLILSILLLAFFPLHSSCLLFVVPTHSIHTLVLTLIHVLWGSLFTVCVPSFQTAYIFDHLTGVITCFVRLLLLSLIIFTCELRLICYTTLGRHWPAQGLLITINNLFHFHFYYCFIENEMTLYLLPEEFYHACFALLNYQFLLYEFCH